MPRSGVLGTYSLPPGTTPQQPNTTITSAVHNSAFDDVQQTFNTPTPIAYGGSGAATPDAARTAFAAFGVVRRQVILASGTYTPHASMLYCDVELQGAGGGGGGTTSTTAQNGGASGGGGGAYSKKRFSRPDIGGGTVTVTLGALGSGGLPGLPGGNAAASSFGTLLTVTGGGGGANLGAVSTSTSTIGGGAANGATAPSLGEINVGGQDGGSAIYPANATGALSGNGGNSLLGLGGAGVTASSGPNGRSGKGYGAGGSGASTTGILNGQGGNGAPAVCIITEYCSE